MVIQFVLITYIFVGTKKDIIKRMSDMTGYNARGRFFTITA